MANFGSFNVPPTPSVITLHLSPQPAEVQSVTPAPVAQPASMSTGTVVAIAAFVGLAGVGIYYFAVVRKAK